MKALFLGLGGIGQRHLRNLLKVIPSAEIGAVRYGNRKFEISDDLSTDKKINIEKKYKIRKFEDLGQAINWQPDMAIISSPSHYHIEPATKLVENHIPVLLEKPISHDREGLDRLVHLSEKNKTFVMVGYMLRFHPGIKNLFSALEEKIIGKIYSAQFTLCTNMPAWHPYEKYTDLYASRKELGGGVILTCIHPVDLIYAIFGLPEKLYTIGGKVSVYDINVEDTVITLFDYNLSGNNLPISLNMSFVERPLKHTISIWGEKGQLSWSEITGCLTVRNEDTGKTREFKNNNFKRNDMFLSEMVHFLDCIKFKKTPITNLSEIVDGHKMALNMKASLENKKPFTYK